MHFLINILELIVFIPFLLWSIYYLFFALAYRFGRSQTISCTKKDNNRFLVVFPTYREDLNIINCIEQFLKQRFSSSHYQVIVVADQLDAEILNQLKQYDVQVLISNHRKRSRVLALNLVMSYNITCDFDAVVILDADSYVESNFLEKVNEAYNAGYRSIQTNCTKEIKLNDPQFFSNFGTQVNNSIYSIGHNNLGIPAGLLGSGMVFEMEWFRKVLKDTDASIGRKKLEYQLLKDNVYTIYLNDVFVHNMRKNTNASRRLVRNKQNDSKYRKAYLRFSRNIWRLDIAILDKYIQRVTPTLILILVWGGISLFVLSFVIPDRIDKWIIVYLIFLLSFMLSIPNRYYSKQGLLALLQLPCFFMAILCNFIGTKILQLPNEKSRGFCLKRFR